MIWNMNEKMLKCIYAHRTSNPLIDDFHWLSVWEFQISQSENVGVIWLLYFFSYKTEFFPSKTIPKV